jgi:hypothetical protein
LAAFPCGTLPKACLLKEQWRHNALAAPNLIGEIASRDMAWRTRSLLRAVVMVSRFSLANKKRRDRGSILNRY